MATVVLFMCDLVSWIRERYGVKYLLFSLYLLSAVAAIDRNCDYLSAFALIWFMGLSLRLLDDLASLAIDRRDHPQRTLCRSNYIPGLIASYFALVVAVSMMLPAQAMVSWVVLNMMLGVCYRIRSPHRIWLILLKYPWLVCIGAGSVRLSVIGSMIFAVFINEILHDAIWLGHDATRGAHVLRHALFLAEGVYFWTSRAT